jgi:hypothetical protein
MLAPGNSSMPGATWVRLHAFLHPFECCRDANFYRTRSLASQISSTHEAQHETPNGQTLRFWVDCSYAYRRYEHTKRTRSQLIAEILRGYEQSDDACAA